MTLTVITGANRGIGLALSKKYAELGHEVIALCRQASPALNNLPVEIVDRIDLSDSLAKDRVLSAIGNRKIDCLINNAGILRNEILGQLDFGSINQQLSVNAIAPLRLTEALLPRMRTPGKVVFITSRMGSMGDNTSGGRYGYRMSKAALNAAAVSLAKDLAPRHISVGILHPGLVGTDMIGGQGDITPEEAAERLITRINALNLENSGTFYHSNGQALPW